MNKRCICNVYHLIFKASEDLVRLFRNDEDKKKFLVLLNLILFRYCASLYAFVLMDTHVHLLIMCETVEQFCLELNLSYTGYFCEKYQHKGAVIAWPCKIIPKPIIDWQIDVLYYILNNPVLAGICKTPGGYKFSSFKFYFGKVNPLKHLISVDTSLVSRSVANAVELRWILKRKLEYQKINRREAERVTRMQHEAEMSPNMPPLGYDF
jgi:putative transposase